MTDTVHSTAVLMFFVAGANTNGATRLSETMRIENGSLRGVPRDSQGVLAVKGIPHVQK